ncbi:MAG: 4Fe-4S binding protein [Clostridia bacterium]
MAKITIDENVCKGCGLCVSVCPKKILELSKDKLNAKAYHPAEVVDMSKCIACAFCATICPDCAIRIEKD